MHSVSEFLRQCFLHLVYCPFFCQTRTERKWFAHSIQVVLLLGIIFHSLFRSVKFMQKVKSFTTAEITHASYIIIIIYVTFTLQCHQFVLSWYVAPRIAPFFCRLTTWSTRSKAVAKTDLRGCKNSWGHHHHSLRWKKKVKGVWV